MTVSRGSEQYRALVADEPEIAESPTSSMARSSSSGKAAPTASANYRRHIPNELN